MVKISYSFDVGGVDALSDVFGVSVVVSSDGESKLISENVGMSENVGDVSVGPKSKSLGSGKSSGAISWAVNDGWAGGGVLNVLLNAEVCSWPILLRARMYAKRNSAGISSGNSLGKSFTSGPSDGVSDSGAGAGVGVGAVCDCCHNFEI